MLANVADDDAARRLDAQGLAAALETLNPREREIIARRYLTDGKPATLGELGKTFSVSAEAIRKTELRAIAKLRKAMGVVLR
jgi:RNA polymerase sigma factor (sigma-70 family)